MPMAMETVEIKTLTALERKRVTRKPERGVRSEMRSKEVLEHNLLKKNNESKIHNDYENDAIEIPVVKKMHFKFNMPTKLEFV